MQGDSDGTDSPGHFQSGWITKSKPTAVLQEGTYLSNPSISDSHMSSTLGNETGLWSHGQFLQAWGLNQPCVDFLTTNI